jgi:anti-sigma regulatory factor (Ser/Thr protein kinase)
MKEMLILPNDLERAAELIEFATNFAARHGFPDVELRRLLVILDELFSNIVRYGYPTDGRGLITICLAYAPDKLEIIVKDDGMPFDPLSMAGPNLDLPAAQRSNGGLGIHLVRGLVDDVRYLRQTDFNRLVLTRLLPPIE